MSYGIIAYAVDIDKVKAIIGSNDYNFLAKLIIDFSEDIAALNEYFYEFTEEGDPIMQDILENMINGNCQSSGADNAEYGYALELICREIGFVMYPSVLTQPLLDWFANLPEINKLGLMADSLRDLIPFPDDLPCITCIDNMQIEAKRAMVHKVFWDEKDPIKKECYSKYIEWLSQAKERNVGLITFLY